MEEPTIKKVIFRRSTPAQRAAYIKRWKDSGKSQRAFSAENGLSYQSLSNWVLREKKRLRQFTQAQKVAFVKQWRDSGKTQRAFCEEHGLNHKSLSNWSMRMKPLLPAENTEQKAGKVKKAKKKRWANLINKKTAANGGGRPNAAAFLFFANESQSHFLIFYIKKADFEIIGFAEFQRFAEFFVTRYPDPGAEHAG